MSFYKLAEVLCLVCLLSDEGYRTKYAAQALHLQAAEENCVLSFVVPRDKMKSSCDVEEKFRRRVSAVEMRVNVYKQQLRDLQTQLSKERQLNAEKIDGLEMRLRDSTVNANTNVIMERRLALLEQEVGQLSNEIVQGGSVRAHNRNAYEDHPDYNFNALDQNPVTLPNLVKSMVQAELQIVMEDYKKQFESYVQEQLRGSNYPMMSEPRGKTATFGENRRSDKPVPRPQKYPDNHDRGDLDQRIKSQLNEIKGNLDKTGQEIAKNVNSYLRDYHERYTDIKTRSRQEINNGDLRNDQNNQNNDKNILTTSGSTTAPATTTTTSTTNTGSGSIVVDVSSVTPSKTATADYEEFQLLNTSELVITEDNHLDVNDSFSGENPDSKETTTKPVVFTSKTDKEIVSSASSRISSGGASGKNKTASGKDKYEENVGMWKESMIMDQEYETVQAEEKLMQKVKLLLYQPLEEMISLVEKQNARVTEQLKRQEETTLSMAKDLNTRMKTVDQSVKRNSLQLQSVSQAVQDLYVKMEKLKSLEATMNEMQENAVSTQKDMPMTVNENEKRVKKLERLMGVYKQSLDHYKNETKHEYKEMREVLKKETQKVKIISKTLQKNITGKVDKLVDRYNESQALQLREMKSDIRNFQDNVLLIKIDVRSLEHKVGSKSNKVEKELTDIRENVQQYSSKSRDFKRKTDIINRRVASLETRMNSTSKIITDLKTEVKLTMTDAWLQIDFDFDGSRSDCFGKQYVKKSKFRKAGYVGVVLCSSKRYKIFLGDSLEGKFLNIGDGDGLGEDHCEFVGGSKRSKITLAPWKPSFGSDRGYARNTWGQEPKMAMINAVKPTPTWYECGVSIP